MRKIKLKEKSPEYAETQQKKVVFCCDIDGCDKQADFRAPKDRSLNEYYRFCKEHVTDYNRAWNFFDGMSEKDVEDHVYNSLFGNRPTWKYTSHIDLEEELLRKSGKFRGKIPHDDKQSQEDQQKHERARKIATDTPEGEAMDIMGLVPPTNLNEIKTRYKELAKQHHPDLNKNNPESEEKLKDINMAYTVLRLAYQKYEKSQEASI